MNAKAWHGTFVLPPFFSWKLVPRGAGKSVGLYVCLLVSYNVAAVNKWVVLYLVKLVLIPLCSVSARSFFCGISVEAETKETWGIYAFFSLPRLWQLKMSRHWSKPHETENFNQYFCPISLQRVGCNYYKCHGNKLGSFHSDSCHCRNSTTQNKNYLSSISLCSSKSHLFNAPFGCTWHNTSKCSYRLPMSSCLGQ